MTPQEFSQKIKAKYPQYQSIDDLTLAQKMVAKHPEYASQVNFGNDSTTSHGGVPLKLFQPNLSSNPVLAGVQQFGTGVAKGAAETVRNLGQVGTAIGRGINAATGTNLPISDAFASGGTFDQATTPQGALQKAGYLTEGGMELITPTGKTKAAGTIGGDLAKGTAGTIKAAESVATGIPREVLTRAATPEYAPRIEKAITQIAEHPNQPYFSLAHDLAKNIATKDTEVSQNLGKSISEFVVKNPTARFDVSPKVDQVQNALKQFRSSGLSIETTKSSSLGGQIAETAKVIRSPQSPFSQHEVDLFNDLLKTMRQSTSVDVHDLLSLRKKFGAAYDAVPLGVNGEPRPYHAAIMAMKDATEKAIDELLPPQLKQANDAYRRFETMKMAFGNRIVDSHGNLKDGAEQFISNLGNLNKGELRAKVAEYKDLTGVDLTDEIQVMKDAQKLSPLFASTGSRTQDILRALIVAGLGTGAGGPVGTVAGLAATSPRLAGKVATTIGKLKGVVRPILGGAK